MSERTITRTNRTTTEQSRMVSFNAPPNAPRPPHKDGRNRKPLIIGLISVIAVIALIATGFAAFSFFSGGEEERGDAEGSGQEAQRQAGNEDFGDDHESLLQMNASNKLDQMGIPFSGNPNDIYIVVTSDQGTEYNLSVSATDPETGEANQETFDSSEDFLVLTPEETGLVIEEGRTGSGEDPTAQGGQCQADIGYGSVTDSCPYVVDFKSLDSFETGVEVGVIATDGEGNIIRTSSMRKLNDKMFFFGTGQDNKFDQSDEESDSLD